MFPLKFSYDEILAGIEAKESFKVPLYVMHSIDEDSQAILQATANASRYLTSFYVVTQVVLFEVAN
jgi:hypothetical protein